MVGTEQVVVRARLSNLGEGLQVVVYTQDRPDLFARICGYFDQAGFSILDAKIHTARFYADHILTRVAGLRDSIIDGHVSVCDMALEAF